MNTIPPEAYEDAYNEGFEARENGKTRADCPYFGKELRVSWNRGFNDGGN